ncbi:hypothetical protein [Microbacterium sp. bgisy189]|uniref:hypothetical protein n=1 Tax=Microbacterium sp. bgisy189 TaxID=3413798 RepID=UPI003EBD3340
MMQLGTRWSIGADIPRAVPAALHPHIRAVEAECDDPQARWTLTFLEGRAIADLDVGVLVEQQADGTVTVREDLDEF